MKIVEMKCENCGATLNIPEGANTVTCQYCHSTYHLNNPENEGYAFEKGRIKAQKEAAEEMFNNFNDTFKNNSINKSAKIVSGVIALIAAIIIITIITLAINQMKFMKEEKAVSSEIEDTDINNIPIFNIADTEESSIPGTDASEYFNLICDSFDLQVMDPIKVNGYTSYTTSDFSYFVTVEANSDDEIKNVILYTFKVDDPKEFFLIATELSYEGANKEELTSFINSNTGKDADIKIGEVYFHLENDEMFGPTLQISTK